MKQKSKLRWSVRFLQVKWRISQFPERRRRSLASKASRSRFISVLDLFEHRQSLPNHWVKKDAVDHASHQHVRQSDIGTQEKPTSDCHTVRLFRHGRSEQSHEIQNFVFWTSVLHRVSRLCFALLRCERITETEDHV